MEQDDFSNFGRGSPKENLCIIILKISPLVQEEMSFEETVGGQTD